MIVLEVRLYFAILEKRKDELSVKLERISQRGSLAGLFSRSHFGIVEHVLRRKAHQFAVAQNVKRQPQTGMFVDNFFDSLIERHLSTLLQRQSKDSPGSFFHFSS